MFYPRSPFAKYPELAHHLRTQVDGAQQIDDLLAWLCHSPRTTTIRVNVLKSSTQSFLSQIETKLRQLTQNSPMLMPVIRAHPHLPDVITIDPLSNDTLVPDPNLKEVIVDVSCGASILRGAHLYAPGVLAMPALTAVNERVNLYADVEGLCKKGHNTVYESPKKVFVGIGVVQMQRYQLYGDNLTPSGIAVLMERTPSGVPSIGDEYFPPGWAMLQNLPSIVCGHVLNPQPGEVILDMCAAPGNKTTHLAELMSDSGHIVALDKTPNKLKLLVDKMEMFDVKSVRCFAFDSTKALDDQRTDGRLEPPFAPNTFDRILLDAPCSALGNRPQLRNDMSPKMLASYPVVQKKLFRAAVGLLKPGGVLVYSTCTVAEAENEQLVAWAIEKFGSEMQLVDATPRFGGPGWSGCGLDETERLKVQRFGQAAESGEVRQHDDDTVGFFIAKFLKNK